MPGTLLAGRYRIVALVGRGGMGEVYRSSDLTLGQTVALKFLPEETARNETARARFQNEVRIARQVSHPNVCRVYDLGEMDGLLYISMEYVDGENLGSLLRRIGRLPAEKALEIARKLCAGLAAAHDKGVLHRDLKPANVMLDGRGHVLITDFGLAALADEVQASEMRHGTPAYMAPEQLAGKEVTFKSDIYALGLLLYELFTGRRAYDAQTVGDLARMQSQASPASPTALVRDLDPVIERVILRCLAPDPQNRPASALAVAASLPGGDPLAAALAAGETPSPQIVAAAGETTGLRPAVAVPCLLGILAALVGAAAVAGSRGMLARSQLQMPPDVLAAKARDMIRSFGYTTPAVDSAEGFRYAGDYIDWIEKNDKPRPRWDEILAGRPGPLVFWFRESPRGLGPEGYGNNLVPGIVTLDDPPPTLSRMVTLQLDGQGRLMSFLAIPPQMEAAAKAQPPDWNALFAAAGLDAAAFRPTEPNWTSLASSDARAAWTGTWPGSASRPLRIEAAAWHGRPVYFQLIGPWTKPTRMQEEPRTPGRKASEAIGLGMLVSVLTGAVLLARRNYVRGRGDRRGAFRLAAAVFLVQFALWIVEGHHLLSLELVGGFIMSVSGALFFSCIVWILYLALEPYARRHWPQALISWSRLLAGRVRDPLVGRDVLFGVVLGVSWLALLQVMQFIIERLGAPPWQGSTGYLGGAREALALLLRQVPNSIQFTLLFFLLMFLLRVLLRREALAVVGFVLLFSASAVLRSSYPVAIGITIAAIYTMAALVVMRFGLLALAVGIFVTDWLGNVPFTFDLSNWYAGQSAFVVTATAALAIYAFYLSLAGRPIFKHDLFD